MRWKMTDTRKCKVLVVGAGPGDMLRKRSVQPGLTGNRRGDKAGGTCLIRGCIPSKALLKDSIFAATQMKVVIWDYLWPQNRYGCVGWLEDAIVERLNKGVGLERCPNYEDGDPKKCAVTEPSWYRGWNVIIATGSSHIDYHMPRVCMALWLQKLPKSALPS